MRGWTFIVAVSIAAAWAASCAADEPIKLLPDNPHYYLFRGKPTVLVGSTEHYGAVLNTAFDYVPYLDELQAKGLNLTRTFSGTYREIPGSFNITDNTLGPLPGKYLCPFARSDQGGNWDGGNKFDLTKWDDAYFARLKDFLAQAGRRGIVVELSLFCTLYDDNLWAANPFNGRNNVNGIGEHLGRRDVYTLQNKPITAVQDAFVRKVVAELRDVDNVYYEICNEPYFENVTAEWQHHVAETIAEAEREFPAKHLIAQNIANDHKKVEKPDERVSILNFHYATPPVTVGENYKLNRVVSDDETGFKGKADGTYRTEGWDFVFAGGGAYDHLDYSFTAKHPRGDFAEYTSPGGGSAALRQSLGALRKAVESIDLAHASPQDGIIKGGEVRSLLRPGEPASTRSLTVRALGVPGKAYLVYARGGGLATLELAVPPGDYTATWIDPRTGDERPATIEGANGKLKLEAPPYEEDLALRVRSR